MLYIPKTDLYNLKLIVNLINIMKMMKNVNRYNVVLNLKEKKKGDLINKCRNHKYIKFEIHKIGRINWDDKLKNNMKFFYPPRFLIVEVIKINSRIMLLVEVILSKYFDSRS